VNKRLIAFLSIISLFLTLPTFPVNAAAKAGAKCSKAGITSVASGKTYTCVKSGKKLVWGKGFPTTAATPTPTTAATPTPTTAATPTPTTAATTTSITTISPISPPQLPATPNSDQFAYQKIFDDGLPVHWDTCKPVTWTYFSEDPSDNSLGIIQKAFQILANASGLSFTYVSPGATNKPSWTTMYDNLEQQPTAQIQVFFANSLEVPVLDSTHYGWAKTFWNYTSTKTYKQIKALYKVAYVMMRKGDGKTWFNQTDDMAFDGLTTGLLHELGHAVGIQHVSDSTQIMYANRNSNYPSGYAQGDKYALFNVAAAIPCGS
jgi:hypothetical protein